MSDDEAEELESRSVASQEFPSISSAHELSYFQRVLLLLGPFLAYGVAFLAGITHIVLDVFLIYVGLRRTFVYIRHCSPCLHNPRLFPSLL